MLTGIHGGQVYRTSNLNRSVYELRIQSPMPSGSPDHQLDLLSCMLDRLIKDLRYDSLTQSPTLVWSIGWCLSHGEVMDLYKQQTM